MRTKILVTVPEEPTIEKFILADRPFTLYINSAFNRENNPKGIVFIVPPKKARETIEFEGGFNP